MDEISDLLAYAHACVRERNIETGERWNLVIETGIFLTSWHVTLSNRHHTFSCGGLLEDSIKAVMERWQVS